MCDTSKIYERSFQLKVGTVVLGAVVIGLMGSVYDALVYHETPFLTVNCIALILSVVFLLCVVSKRIPDTAMQKRLEIAYHFLTALLIFMTGSVYIFSVMVRGGCHLGCADIMTKRYLAALFGFANGILYGLVGWNLLEIKIVSRNPATA